MLDVRGVLLLVLALLAAGFAVFLARAARRATTPVRPGPLLLGIGFVTDFFDTLGIGSFAPTTALFRLLRLVARPHIPGTLNVGHALRRSRRR